MNNVIKIIFVQIEQISKVSPSYKRRVLKYVSRQFLILELNNLGIKETDIFSDYNGKKRIKNNQFFFSISYSDISFIIAFSKNEIGIDIERNRTMNITNLLTFYNIFTQKTILESEHPVSEFLKLWTISESLCKFWGISIFDYIEYYKNMDIGDVVEGWNYHLVAKKYFYHRVVDDYFISICSGSIGEVTLFKSIIK